VLRKLAILFPTTLDPVHNSLVDSPYDVQNRQAEQHVLQHVAIPRRYQQQRGGAIALEQCSILRGKFHRQLARKRHCGTPSFKQF
jgi:hypothetical protein